MRTPINANTRVSIYVRQIPIRDQTFWCLAFTIALTISLALAIALWKLGVVGGFILGIVLMKLLQR